MVPTRLFNPAALRFDDDARASEGTAARATGLAATCSDVRYPGVDETRAYFASFGRHLKAEPGPGDCAGGAVHVWRLTDDIGCGFRMAGHFVFPTLRDLWRCWYRTQPELHRSRRCVEMLAASSLDWTAAQRAAMREWVSDHVGEHRQLVPALRLGPDRARWPWTDACSLSPSCSMKTRGWPWNSVAPVGPLDDEAVADSAVLAHEWKAEAARLARFDLQRSRIFARTLGDAIDKIEAQVLEASLPAAAYPRLLRRL
ncbi:hypothetical protein KPL74_08840 [Bacillus sp. NP157]|nr:hypothetical protein KPL74_08840 [Bacillus sp. NP157]